MDDVRVGAAFRAVRLRRRWRQQDVADRADCSRALVSLVERGHLGSVALDTLRRIAGVLEIRIEVVARWRGGELDRLLNAGHSALHESLAAFFATLPGWEIAPEVSFSVYGERGVIDILAWHAPSRTLLVTELKTEIVDVQALIGGVDRKRRLSRGIARERGWDARRVACWVIVTRDRTNERRMARHRRTLAAAFPDDGTAMRAWTIRPDGEPRGMSLWADTSYANGRSARSTSKRRVRLGRAPAAGG